MRDIKFRVWDIKRKNMSKKVIIVDEEDLHRIDKIASMNDEQFYNGKIDYSKELEKIKKKYSGKAFDVDEKKILLKKYINNVLGIEFVGYSICNEIFQLLGVGK